MEISCVKEVEQNPLPKSQTRKHPVIMKPQNYTRTGEFSLALFFIKSTTLSVRNTSNIQSANISSDIMVYEPLREKTNNLEFRPGLHKLVCTVTEAGHGLEILDLSRRGTELYKLRKQRC